MRHADGDDCPKGCKLDVIYSRYSGTTGGVDPDFLSRVFPGAVVKDWKPKGGDKLTPNEQGLITQLVWAAGEEAEGVWRTKEQLADAVGITPHSVWEALRRPRVRQELARRGIAIEPVKGSHSGMRIRQVANGSKQNKPSFGCVRLPNIGGSSVGKRPRLMLGRQRQRNSSGVVHPVGRSPFLVVGHV